MVRVVGEIVNIYDLTFSHSVAVCSFFLVLMLILDWLFVTLYLSGLLVADAY